ncbi:MAG: hypothetical protein IPJ66_11915 [Bacteroidetes bacterium]|nr:hypothetical protein [Bacteroidota bacterium]
MLLRWSKNGKDVSPNANNINLHEHFKVLSLKVFNMVQFPATGRNHRNINQSTMADNQTCEAWLNEVTMFTAEEAASIVKRLGLILYRMAMLFTALRKFENGEAANQVVCTDEDLHRFAVGRNLPPPQYFNVQQPAKAK